MNTVHILYPAFAMFFLTLFIAVRLGMIRVLATKAGEVDIGFFRLFRDQEYEEPDRLRLTSRHYINLFEVPTLFYVAALISYVTDQANVVTVTLAWAYVGARVIHTLIHLTVNIVLWRFYAFIVSWSILTLFWIVLAVSLF